jgi:hypothetical protein
MDAAHLYLGVPHAINAFLAYDGAVLILLPCCATLALRQEVVSSHMELSTLYFTPVVTSRHFCTPYRICVPQRPADGSSAAVFAVIPHSMYVARTACDTSEERSRGKGTKRKAQGRSGGVWTETLT